MTSRISNQSHSINISTRMPLLHWLVERSLRLQLWANTQEQKKCSDSAVRRVEAEAKMRALNCH